MSQRTNGSEILNGGGAGGADQGDQPQDGGGGGPNIGAADLLSRSKERSSRGSSEAGSREFDEGSVSSSSSFEGTDISRVRAALGEVGPGLENLDGRQHCSPMWFAMLEKGIKEKRITEDDAVAANAIIGFTRKVLDHQEDLRKYRHPITRNLELTLPDKRGVGNQICWNSARFFEYTGTNTFSRIQKGAIPRDGIRAKTRRFPTYQDLAESLADIVINIIIIYRSQYIYTCGSHSSHNTNHHQNINHHLSTIVSLAHI